MDEQRLRIRREFVGNGICRIELERNNVLLDLLKVYKDNRNIIEKEIRVSFRNEQGYDVGGLTRELFAAFWVAAETVLLEGGSARVPIMHPQSTEIYRHLGRILSHGYILTGFFPLCSPLAFSTSLIGDITAVTKNMLLESFLQYIDPIEAEAVIVCLTTGGFSDTILGDTIVPMLSRFRCSVLPSASSFREVITPVAHFAILSQPYYTLCELKRGMFEAHSQLWERCYLSLVAKLRATLAPTAQHVIQMISEPAFHNESESRTFDYFRRFILSLPPVGLCRLQQFVTGNPQCGLQQISVQFYTPASSFASHPTASTSREMWSFDAI